MKTATAETQIPDSLARYHERAMSVLRYQLGAGPVGPSARSFPAYNPQQLKFLSDIAHAFHNLTGEEGVAFFYTEAAKINAAWAGREADLFDDRSNGSFFKELWPLPVKP